MGRYIRYAPCSGVLAGGAIANVAQSHLHFFYLFFFSFLKKLVFSTAVTRRYAAKIMCRGKRNCGASRVTGVGLSFSNCLDATQTDATSRVIKSLFAWTPAGDIRRDRQRVGLMEAS